MDLPKPSQSAGLQLDVSKACRHGDAGPARGAQRADAGDVARNAGRWRRDPAGRRAGRRRRGAGHSFSAGLDRRDARSRPRASVARLLELTTTGVSAAIDELPAGLHLAARPAVREHRRRAGLRHRRRLPAGAQLRPAGGDRGRPVLHEGVRAGPRAGPDRNKAAGRGCRVRQSTRDLRHGTDGRRRGGRGHRPGAHRRPGRPAGRHGRRPRRLPSPRRSRARCPRPNGCCRARRPPTWTSNAGWSERPRPGGSGSWRPHGGPAPG